MKFLDFVKTALLMFICLIIMIIIGILEPGFVAPMVFFILYAIYKRFDYLKHQKELERWSKRSKYDAMYKYTKRRKINRTVGPWGTGAVKLPYTDENFDLAYDIATNDACNICDTVFDNGSNFIYADARTCYALRDMFPHRVDDIPPADNPFRFWWYQTHGYSPECDSADTEKTLREGRRYWMEHQNYAWDSGYVTPPKWYVEKKLKAVSL